MRNTNYATYEGERPTKKFKERRPDKRRARTARRNEIQEGLEIYRELKKEKSR